MRLGDEGDQEIKPNVVDTNQENWARKRRRGEERSAKVKAIEDCFPESYQRQIGPRFSSELYTYLLQDQEVSEFEQPEPSSQ